MEFEQELMPKHGLTPWDDSDQFSIIEENRQIMRAHSIAKRHAKQTNIEWTEEDEQGYQDQLANLRRRLKARLLWERLLESRAELQAKLLGKKYDGSVKYRKAMERYKKLRNDKRNSDSR